jgi:uncharacterized protein (DUF983 family)
MMAAGENVNVERRPLITLLRCLRLLCPACGQSSIVRMPFKIKDHCPSCGSLFKREEGFFVGAISINVVTTELVILALYLISLPFISSNYELVLAILFIFALLFPVAFYHHSWSLWLSFDHLVETLPKDAKKRSEPTKGRSENGDAD